MALKTFVKISGVNNLSDARYCAGMEVNQLGFNIESRSPNYTDIQKFKEISDWLSGVEYVGEIDNASAVDIADLIDGYPLDAVQVSSPKQVELAAQCGLPVILRIDIAMITADLLASLKDQVSYFLIESFYAGQLSPDLLELTSNYPIVVGFGFDADSVNHFVSTSTIKGIAIKGGDEIKPGLKDFDEMADILEVLEIDDTV